MWRTPAGSSNSSMQRRKWHGWHTPNSTHTPITNWLRSCFPNGAGSIFSFGIEGGRQAGSRFIESVELFSHLANVGDVRSLVIHPGSTTHQQMTSEQLAAAGIGEELIRLSVGLEDPDDLIADLRRSLRDLAAAMKQIEVAGETVAFHTGGGSTSADRPVVLIHGAGMDHTEWRYQTRRLAGLGLLPIAPDLPGHGRSGGKPLASIEEMGRWTGELIEHLGLASVAVVGHSMGSFVAMETFRSRPDLVDRLVLIATSDRMAVHPELLDAASAGDRHAVDLMIGWMHSGDHRYGGHKTAGSWMQAMVRRLLEEHLDSALPIDLAACDAYDPAPVAPGVIARTLVIQGDADRMTAVSGARRLVGLFPNARLIEIPHAGHMVVSESSTHAPDLLIEELLDP